MPRSQIHDVIKKAGQRIAKDAVEKIHELSQKESKNDLKGTNLGYSLADRLLKAAQMIAGNAKRQTITGDDVNKAKQILDLGMRHQMHTEHVEKQKVEKQQKRSQQAKGDPLNWTLIAHSTEEKNRVLKEWFGKGSIYHSKHIEKELDSDGNPMYVINLSTRSQAQVNREVRERKALLPKPKSVPELRGRAALLGIKGAAKMKRPQLIKAIGDRWGPW